MNKKSLNKKFIVRITILTMCMVLVCSSTVFATSMGTEGVKQFEDIMRFIAYWINKIGAAITFFGAGQFILSLKSQSPEQKSSGITFFVVGLMLAGIASETALKTLGVLS